MYSIQHYHTTEIYASLNTKRRTRVPFYLNSSTYEGRVVKIQDQEGEITSFATEEKAIVKHTNRIDRKQFEPSMSRRDRFELGRLFCPCTSSPRRRGGVGRVNLGGTSFCL